MKQTKEYSEMRQTWNRWRGRMAAHEALMVQARTAADKHDVQSARSALRKWKDRAADIQRLQSLAINNDNHRLLSNGLQTFTKRVNRFKQLEEGAIMTNTFFKLRTCFQAWQQALQVKIQSKWIADKRKRDTKEIFDAWLNLSRQQQLLRKKSRSLVKAHKKRLEKRTLQHWFARVINIKNTELKATEERNRAILGQAFERWTTATVKQGEMLSLMQSFRDVRDQDTLRHLLRGWNQAAKSSAIRKQASAVVVELVKDNLMQAAMKQWRYRARALLLDPKADEFIQRVDDGLAYAVLTAWKAKSPKLPAIKFHANLLRRHAWTRWRASLPHAKILREAARVQDQKLCSDVLQAWKSAYRAKIARRAAARSRGNAMRLRAVPHLDLKKPAVLSPVETSHRDLGDATAASDLLRDVASHRPSGRRRSLYRIE